MAVYVCLLRAIGPVTHAKMSMAALREACEAAGLSDVSTVGNTGNVILRSTRSPTVVRMTVQDVVDAFGIGPMCEVFVRTPRQMQFVLDSNPFPDAARDKPDALAVCIFHNSPRWPAWVRSWDGPQKLATAGAHLIIDYPSSISGARIDVEKKLGTRMTMRNWRVFGKLAARAGELAQAS